MSQDLLTQLADYGAYCDERQGTVSADDVIDTIVPLPMPTPPTAPRRGWLVAVAAAALILIVGGGVNLLTSFGDSIPPGDEPAETTIPETTVPVTTVPVTTVPDTLDFGDGQTVGVTVSGLSGRVGDHLAGVLYEGELVDLDRDALGGFWSVISFDDSTTSAVIREPADPGVGRFPFVSAEALTVEPGMYTLVVWMDDDLAPVSRWVPINTDGQGLNGCQHVFEVSDDAQTDVVVTANLHPDGWNINCTAR